MWVQCREKSGEQNVGMPLRCCKQPSFSTTPPLRENRRDKGASAQNAAGSSAQSVPPAAVPYSNKPPLGAAVGQT